MDIAELIAWKERRILLTKRIIGMLKDYPQTPDNIEYVQELQEEIKDLEKSIQDDRQIQLAEAQVSGRKKWTEDIWKYILVILITSILSSFATKLIFG